MINDLVLVMMINELVLVCSGNQNGAYFKHTDQTLSQNHLVRN